MARGLPCCLPQEPTVGRSYSANRRGRLRHTVSLPRQKITAIDGAVKIEIARQACGDGQQRSRAAVVRQLETDAQIEKKRIDKKVVKRADDAVVGLQKLKRVADRGLKTIPRHHRQVGPVEQQQPLFPVQETEC